MQGEYLWVLIYGYIRPSLRLLLNCNIDLALHNIIIVILFVNVKKSWIVSFFKEGKYVFQSIDLKSRFFIEFYSAVLFIVIKDINLLLTVIKFVI